MTHIRSEQGQTGRQAWDSNTGEAGGSLWYKDAVIYELHVRAFADSNGDGTGDFQGLIGKLDYLRDLGITTIWLLPFFPSPLRDDGYDIADYTAVHPAYGTLDDFREFLREAHLRDLRVIIELVLNHTSDQHPWFQRARRAPEGSVERDFYVWSDTPDRYQDARIIFQDYEQSNWSWDPVADAYYWHRFYSHQPDLNYEQPAVRQAIFETVDFWLEMGVDGLRLDAVPYLVEAEGTTSENLPGTHQVLKELRRHIDERFEDRLLLAEANQWPEDAVAYFGDGDECQMAFHFPLMPRLFMALRTEDRLPVTDIMEQTPAIPETCQWGIFLRNHDELTLEMVTDEERLYMYHAFAPDSEARINLGIRRRLAPLLGNSRRRIELMNALMCSLPGTPVIYYGDEIGMGDNIYLGDRDGVRTPMQWSADRNAGFSRASPQRLYLPLVVDYEYHHETVQVEAQTANPHSLLAFMKRLLAVRGRSQAFGRGSLEMLHPSNHRVLAFVREYDGESVLVVANLSRFSQAVELDLSRWQGYVPQEAFGRISFWEIDDRPYPLTLGPHGFYWFLLTPADAPARGNGDADDRRSLPLITIEGGWENLLRDNELARLERVLPDLLACQVWLRGSPEAVLNAHVLDVIPVPDVVQPTWVAPVRVAYSDREPEMYQLALSFIPAGEADDPGSGEATRIARVDSALDGEAVVIDAISEGSIEGALRWLADAPETPLPGRVGQIEIEWARPHTRVDLPAIDAAVSPPADRAGSNPVFQSGDVVIKFLRRLSEAANPEWEIGQALTDAGFRHAPAILGALQYRRPGQPAMTLAVLQTRVENQGHAWDFTARFLDDLLDQGSRQGIVVPQPAALTARELFAALGEELPEPLDDLLEPWLQFARLLGRRTAELHHTLATVPGHPELAPEVFTPYAGRSLYQSMRGLTARTLRSLGDLAPRLANDEQALARAMTEHQPALYDRFQSMLGVHAPGSRIRGHGDFHLGQVLLTEHDLVFVDFEGEPDRFPEERRLKASPLRDVAGMLHSIQLAALHAAARYQGGADRSADRELGTAALLDTWRRYASAAFLEEYLSVAESDRLLPPSLEERVTMLDALLLERTVYEVWHAAQHRPQHLRLPLELLRQMLDEA